MTAPDTRKYLSVAQWCYENNIHRATFYREVRLGRVRIEKYGRRTLVPAGQSLPTRPPSAAIGAKSTPQNTPQDGLRLGATDSDVPRQSDNEIRNGINNT